MKVTLPPVQETPIALDSDGVYYLTEATGSAGSQIQLDTDSVPYIT